MNRWRHIKFIILLPLFIFSCSYSAHDSDLYKKIKPFNKVILMPPSNLHALKEIKKLFINNGWKIIVEDKQVTTTEFSNNKMASTDIKLASYKLYYDSRVRSGWTCIKYRSDLPLDYSISIVDYKTGEEIYSANGFGCTKEEMMPELQKDLKELL
jgi:hypothetical protein